MIYFDHNATTYCLDEVLSEMIPYFSDKFGNASSGFYPLAWQSDFAIQESRKQIANLVDVDSEEIVFTSGATESCYLGIRGLLELFYLTKKDFKPHVMSSKMEHSAVKEVLEDLEKMGWIEITWLDNNEEGIISFDSIKREKKDTTVLIALMLANNVTGVIQDIKSIAEWARNEKIFTFCDTTQAIGKIPISFRELTIDMATISAHKFYGPKGIGALYLRKGRPTLRIKHLISGGGQENKKRGGTYNVPSIVGFGKACELAINNLHQYTVIEQFRNEFESRLKNEFDVHIWGEKSVRLPHVSMFGLKGKRGVDILNKLKGKYAFSLGSACQAHENKPSYVIQCMNPHSPFIDGSIRLSFGLKNTRDEMMEFLQDLKNLYGE